jgi:hypothetical protein
MTLRTTGRALVVLRAFAACADEPGGGVMDAKDHVAIDEASRASQRCTACLEVG